MTKPNFSQLAALRIEHEAFGRAVKRAKALLLTIQGKIAPVEAKIKSLKDELRTAGARLEAAKAALKAAGRRRNEAASNPVASSPEHGTVLDLRRSQIDELKARIKIAKNDYDKTQASEKLVQAERQLNNDIGHLAGLDAEVEVAQKRIDLWTACLQTGIPADIGQAKLELEAVHQEVAEQRERIVRAEHTYEAVSERVDAMEITLCEPALAGTGGA